MKPQSSRNAGLDTLRACAIALVFMYHYAINVSQAPTFGVASEIGWTGVDLFFVLSGYLIGSQICAALARGRPFSLWQFYGRRALRTLPAFWVVLALYFMLPATMGGNTPPPLWRFLTFTQNLGLQPGTAFSHAWSLCIEEQFYLVLPVTALLLWLTRSIRLAWLTLAALIVCGILARSLLWLRYGADATNYFRFIYYATWCRFDELLPGVALAMLQHFHPRQWRRVLHHGNWLLGVGLVATALVMTLFLTAHETPAGGFRYPMTAFGYPLLACSFALLTLAALSPHSLLYRLRLPGTRQLALWSYAIYLSHKAVLHALAKPLTAAGLDVTASSGASILTVASIAAGWLLYACVETPFMRLRARWFGAPRPQSVVAHAVPAQRQISAGIPTP